MPRWLRHITDPETLILAWQPDDSMRDRFRWAVGEIAPDEDGFVLSYYSNEKFEELNDGRTYSDLMDLGYRGYPGFPPKHGVHRAGDAFLRRLPPRGRADFSSYRAHFRIPPEAEISDAALLGITEAKLPSDGFSIVDPLASRSVPADLLNEVAGYRYYMAEGARALEVGDEVQILPEPENPKDVNAVQFRFEGKKIGNVNRLQAPAILGWLQHNLVTGIVERINGTPDRPRIFVFVEVRRASAQLDT